MSEVNNTNFQGILWGSKNSAEDIDALKKAANDGTISKDEFTSIFGEDNYNELLESTNMKDSTEDEISDALLIAMQNLDDNEYDADEDDEYSTSLASIEERTGAKDLDLNDFEKITEYINGNVNEDSAEELTVQSLIKDATKLNDYEWQKETLKKAGIDIDNGWVRRPTEEEMANWTEEQKNNVSYYYNNPETRECVKALLNGDGSTLIVHTTIEKGTTGNIILYAKWEAFEIEDVYSNINYVLNEGVNSPENKEKYLEGVMTVLYPATKEGYVFLGWSLEENATEYISSINEKFSGEITLYANYDYAKYTIVYDLQEGDWGNEVEFIGAAVTSITGTANSGFWSGFASNIYLYASSQFTSNLNATWSFRVGIAMDELVGTYVVKTLGESGGTFEYAGCDYIIVISSSYGNYSSTSSFRNSVQIGQVVKFIGDPDAGTATVEFYNPEDVSGSEVKNFISEYTINELPALLPTPKLEGKIFKGWGLTKDATEVIVSLEKGMTGNLTLYAIWE